jgi:hypothetical protein
MAVIDPVADRDLDQEDDFFLMANLSPLFTGLPFYVWISTRGYAQHDIRVKISEGMKVKRGELISVALRPELREIGSSRLTSEELTQLRRWVELNWSTLLAYWDGEIATEQAIGRLKPID